MMNWFMAGGWGMFTILIVGAGAIGFGVKAIGKPTAERIAILRSLTTLLAMVSLFTFGTNMWAVNVHLSDDAFLKKANIAATDLPFMGIIGVTESVQALTLGALLGAIVVVIRIIAEAKKASAEAG